VATPPLTLSDDELNLLKRGYDQMNEISESGKAKGMSESAIERYVEQWVQKHPGGEAAYQDLKAEMRRWSQEYEEALRKAEQGRGHLEGLTADRNDLIRERFELLELQKDPATKSAANARRLNKIDVELAQNKALTKEREVAQRPLEEAVNKLRSSIYDRLRDAKIADAVRKDVLKSGIDDVGKLKVPASDVTIDHILSVKEFSEMEGVRKLTPAERLEILNNRKNLISMDHAANSARQETHWSQWDGWSRFYADLDIQEKMARREADIRDMFQKMISEKLAGK